MIPPQRFLPAGKVEIAKLYFGVPPFVKQRVYKGKRAEGVRYERKAQEHLEHLFPDTYVRSPWFYFKSEGGHFRWCQPDGLIIDVVAGKVICIEIKYNHTSDAWWQIRELYLPVLRKLFPEELWVIEVCEVVKWFDPAVRFPEPIELASTVSRVSDKFKVHIWRP